MKQKTIATLALMFALLVFPMVNADVVFPTVTNVYFEQDGQAYNESIEFTVNGYGYSYPVGPPVEKKQGTYTPEVVFSFSALYNNYGEKIYENYYMNYDHIDYYEVEGKTSDGETFLIKNLEDIPLECTWLEEIDESQTDDRGDPIMQTCELRFNLDDADWNFTPPVPEPQGFWNKILYFFKSIFGGKSVR